MLQRIKAKLRHPFRPAGPAALASLTTVDQDVPVITLGSRYGGWTLPENALSSESRVYLFGAGEDISFDIALIRHFGAEVHVFDPTPRAKTHVDGLIAATRSHRPFPVNGDPEISYEIERPISKSCTFIPSASGRRPTGSASMLPPTPITSPTPRSICRVPTAISRPRSNRSIG